MRSAEPCVFDPDAVDTVQFCYDGETPLDFTENTGEEDSLVFHGTLANGKPAEIRLVDFNRLTQKADTLKAEMAYETLAGGTDTIPMKFTETEEKTSAFTAQLYFAESGGDDPGTIRTVDSVSQLQGGRKVQGPRHPHDQARASGGRLMIATATEKKPVYLSRLRAVPMRRVRGRFDSAATTDNNRRHWANADALSADAAASVEVRRTLRNRARYAKALEPVFKARMFSTVEA